MKKLNKTSYKKDDRVIYAFLATFLSIIGVIIALILKRNDKYVMYYAKQSLVIFFIACVTSVIGWLVVWIPITGRIINFALNIIILILWVISWIFALTDKEKEIPIVSELAEKLDF